MNDSRPKAPPRTLRPGQRAEITIFDLAADGPRTLASSADVFLEAPNWTLDGRHLILNGGFELWRADAGSGELEKIEMSEVPAINNDHVLDPDGEHIYVSAYDWRIYRVPLTGGVGRSIAGDPGIAGFKHFLHGVSPDGRRLAITGVCPRNAEDPWGTGDVFTMSSGGDGDYVRLTDGPGHSDGGEYSPDGEWIYFNSEMFDGHAQIARCRPDGRDLQQLTFDENVNWFPHIAPNGEHACYVAFPPGTEGHPGDTWVDIKLVDRDDWSAATTIARVFGGQGALNVNSWAPDGASFAFMGYPEGGA